MATEHTDDLNQVDIVWKPDSIVDDAVLHFHEKVDEWIYPAKSYFVAICYANWIANDFNENFLDVLNDIDLLPHDPHFKVYSEEQTIYDDILWYANWKNNEQGMVPDVRKYYEEEMLIGQL
tara:strand:- start:444 stop:806 length:363 start_codon:yes stop_codon:yes gene_type:complete